MFRKDIVKPLMNKTIEKIEQYKSNMITKAIDKLKDTYEETKGNYNDTGYDRYYNKMKRCEEEIEELEAYRDKDNAVSEAFNEKVQVRAELDKIKKDISSKLFYILADMPESTDIRNLKEYVEKISL